jgi:acyl-CoA synthetase (AMP-forming)/AMP-acid ligase II
VHDRAVQWAYFFLANGVKHGDMVATYLMNSADFMVICLGLFCIGCAPAHLNYNLKGEGLIRCLKIAGVKMVLIDSEPDCAARFEACKETVEKELGVTPFTVDSSLVEKVYSGPIDVPGNE